MATIERVLVIDDEPDVREVLDLTLSGLAGWHVLAASSGLEGVMRAFRHRPDVILLDVMMPEMDGPETLAVLRSLPATRDIPVLIMTAKARFSGPGTILKPFDPTTLATQIGTLIDAFETPQHQPLLDVELATRMDALWSRYRDGVLASVDRIVECGALLDKGRASESHVDAACLDAHKLIGTAGVFRFGNTAHLCRELEELLRAAPSSRDPGAVQCLAAVVRGQFEVQSIHERWVAA